MYNTDDLAQIESAILKLQSGERVVSVAYGDHAVKYAEVDLQELIRSAHLTSQEISALNKDPAKLSEVLVQESHKLSVTEYISTNTIEVRDFFQYLAEIKRYEAQINKFFGRRDYERKKWDDFDNTLVKYATNNDGVRTLIGTMATGSFTFALAGGIAAPVAHYTAVTTFVGGAAIGAGVGSAALGAFALILTSYGVVKSWRALKEEIEKYGGGFKGYCKYFFHSIAGLFGGTDRVNRSVYEELARWNVSVIHCTDELLKNIESVDKIDTQTGTPKDVIEQIEERIEICNFAVLLLQSVLSQQERMLKHKNSDLKNEKSNIFFMYYHKLI